MLDQCVLSAQRGRSKLSNSLQREITAPYCPLLCLFLKSNAPHRSIVLLSCVHLWHFMRPEPVLITSEDVCLFNASIHLQNPNGLHFNLDIVRPIGWHFKIQKWIRVCHTYDIITPLQPDSVIVWYFLFQTVKLGVWCIAFDASIITRIGHRF